MKRFLIPIAFFTSLSLSACTSVFQDVRATFDYALSSADDVELTPAEIAEFPYTAQYANWDDSAQILVVLGFIDGNEYHWVTGDRETLITERGRVVRTTRLDHELVNLSNQSEDPLRCILATDCNPEWTREGSFSDPTGRLYSRTIVSRFTVEGEESLTLPVGERRVTKVIEEGYFTLGRERDRRSFTNTFWLEDDGHVVKSRQYLTPGRQGLTLTQVKWVGRDES